MSEYIDYDWLEHCYILASNELDNVSGVIMRIFGEKHGKTPLTDAEHQEMIDLCISVENVQKFTSQLDEQIGKIKVAAGEWVKLEEE